MSCTENALVFDWLIIRIFIITFLYWSNFTVANVSIGRTAQQLMVMLMLTTSARRWGGVDEEKIARCITMRLATVLLLLYLSDDIRKNGCTSRTPRCEDNRPGKLIHFKLLEGWIFASCSFRSVFSCIWIRLQRNSLQVRQIVECNCVVWGIYLKAICRQLVRVLLMMLVVLMAGQSVHVMLVILTVRVWSHLMVMMLVMVVCGFKEHQMRTTASATGIRGAIKSRWTFCASVCVQ